MHCFTILGAALGITILLTTARSGLGTPFIELFEGSTQSSDENVLKATRALLGSSFSFLLPLCLLVILGGAFQTRFLFSLQAFGRRGRQGAKSRSRGARLVWSVLPGMMWCLICWMLVKHSFHEIEIESMKPLPPVKSLALWRSSLIPETELFSWSRMSAQLRDRTFYFSGVLLGFAIMLAALSRFVAVISFRAEHSMSRSEMEAENRELEMSPDVRRRISQLSEE